MKHLEVISDLCIFFAFLIVPMQVFEDQNWYWLETGAGLVAFAILTKIWLHCRSRKETQ